jgi:putative tricarboxylic transport membrane protein
MPWGRLTALLALALGLAAWVLSLGLPRSEGPGPELFPRVLGTVLVLGGLALLRQREDPAPLGPGWPRVLGLALLFLLAPGLLPRLGLAWAAALLAGTAALLYREPWPRGALVALFTWLLVYWVFVRVLGVPA